MQNSIEYGWEVCRMIITKKLDNKLVKEIKRIEKTAYPKQMRALQGENAQGIMEYCRDEENKKLS